MMHRLGRAIAVSLFLLSIFSVSTALSQASPSKPLETVPYVDVKSYLGTWYEISRNPLPFAADCACSQQTLGFDTIKNHVTVFNSCNDKSPAGVFREIRGFATSDDPVSNARFTVDFGLPQRGQYWIIGLGAKYEYAVISEPSRRSLYILSKTPVLDPALYVEALGKAQAQVDTSKLLFTEQNGCAYPPEIVPYKRLPATPITSAPPTSPKDIAHPGNIDYSHQAVKKSVRCLGRDTPVFLSTRKAKQPLVAFGHGQALDVSHYEKTHQHLAGKGIASLHPPYDTGFFDRNWKRMGEDYAAIVACVATAFPGEIDASRIVYSGHSKGAYVAQIAAGLAPRVAPAAVPKAVVLFNPAGSDQTSLKLIPTDTAMTVVFSDQDTVVEKRFSEDILKNAGSKMRQMFTVLSYKTTPALKADHFWTLTKPSTFGGGNESSFHYFGSWKWLTAAALDLEESTPFTHPYLYTPLALNKGLPGVDDQRDGNF
jgi:apolipoprotein D and lipocalin family protein